MQESAVSDTSQAMAWVQCPCDAAGNVDPTTTQFCMAPVLELSHRGVRLVLPRPVMPDSQLRFEIRLESGKFSSSMVARIVGGRRGKAVDQWLMDCELLEPLTDETLDLLRAKSPSGSPVPSPKA